MQKLAFFAACALVGLVLADSAQAQRPARYYPRSPTVSPYLALTQTNFGALPNYYALVRPLQRQQVINAATADMAQQQSRDLQQIQGLLSTGQGPIAPTGQPIGQAAGFMRPSLRATYMDTRTYYPPLPTQRALGR